jgi:DNA topoisomerase-1
VHNSKFISLKAGVDDPYTIATERSVELIIKKREDDKNKTIKTFAEDKDILVLNGRFGPYISYKKENFKIPKSKDAASLTYEECVELMKVTATKPRKKKK